MRYLGLDLGSKTLGLAISAFSLTALFAFLKAVFRAELKDLFLKVLFSVTRTLLTADAIFGTNDPPNYLKT